MYLQPPRINSSIHHCHTGLFPRVHFISDLFKFCSFIHSLFFGNTRFIPHTAAAKVYLTFCFMLLVLFLAREDDNVASLAYLVIPAISHTVLSHTLSFVFRPEKINISVTHVTCHTGLIATQDFFFTSLFATWNLCMHCYHTGLFYSKITTKVKMLHASFATKVYLPHRIIACFKVTPVY